MLAKGRAREGFSLLLGSQSSSLRCERFYSERRMALVYKTSCEAKNGTGLQAPIFRRPMRIATLQRDVGSNVLPPAFFALPKLLKHKLHSSRIFNCAVLKHPVNLLGSALQAIRSRRPHPSPQSHLPSHPPLPSMGERFVWCALSSRLVYAQDIPNCPSRELLLEKSCSIPSMLY